MIFEQFEVKGLSHFSYAVGCNGSKEICIIDPKRDYDTYIEYARKNEYTIAYVTETHIHADFASGAKELAEKTGAKLMLSAYDKNELFDVQFPHTELAEGDRIVMGGISLEVLHTPGHTPEHISFLLYDKARSEKEALMLFSGDFLFIGSVGRPDLLGEDAKIELAKKLYHSVNQKLKALPDGLLVYPGHGAGSLCGAGMTAAASSTLGMERISNPYLNKNYSEEEFVTKILSNSPPFPDYYKRMKKINSEGPRSLNGVPKPRKMSGKELAEALKNKESELIDLRHPLAYGGGHICGSYNISNDNLMSTWAPWVIPYDRPIYLISDNPDAIDKNVRKLIQLGFDQIEGCIVEIEQWVQAGCDFMQTQQLSVHSLHERLKDGEDAMVLDVRNDNEWNNGHIQAAKHIFLGNLPKEADQLGEKDKKIYAICGGGYRSSIAIGVLQNKGYTNIVNIFGGMGVWKTSNLPIE